MHSAFKFFRLTYSLSFFSFAHTYCVDAKIAKNAASLFTFFHNMFSSLFKNSSFWRKFAPQIIIFSV